jgi:hypothetical protein
MDRAGVATSYSSITVPGIYFAEGFGNQQAPPGEQFKNDVVALAREANEFGAKMKSDYPGRFPPVNIDGFRNRADAVNTIRVDSQVVHETDSHAKGDESRWMRFTLDTVGKTAWPLDRQKRPIYPEGFEELSAKLKRPLHPPATCIASCRSAC